jgi:Flp pilus assembly protein TadB
MSPNLIGLGLIVAAAIFLIAAVLWSGVVLWILGVVCLVGGVGALWMTWQRNRRATA